MHPISFIEIGTENARQEAEFFSELFDWPWQHLANDGAGWFDAGALKVGVHGKDSQTGMVPYFQVADIEAAAETVQRLGGRAELPGADEAGFGRFINCISAQGVRFGLHQTVGRL
ncbi:MAG: hypothetical protein ROO70_05290 [Labrenzia sp.]